MSDGTREQGFNPGSFLTAEQWLQDAPPNVTAGWLFEHLLDRSPEIVFLAFTPIAIVPATSPVAGAILAVAALPMIFRHRHSYLPRWAARKIIPRAKIERVLQTLDKLLSRYETYALKHPHPPAGHHTVLVGTMVTILSATLLVPLPFSNVLPGITIGTVALASLEQDRALLILASALTILSLLSVSIEAFWTYHLATILA